MDDSNFQQRVDSTKNEEGEQADDVLTIKAFRDTWALGIHSYLSYFCVNDCISAASCSRPAGSLIFFKIYPKSHRIFSKSSRGTFLVPITFRSSTSITSLRAIAAILPNRPL
jgi:hypothetical protein